MADWARSVLAGERIPSIMPREETPPMQNQEENPIHRGKGLMLKEMEAALADSPEYIEHSEHLALLKSHIRPFTLGENDFFVAYCRISHNIALIKGNTPIKSLRKLKAYEIGMGESFAGNLPIVPMGDRPESAKCAKNDMICKACSLPLGPCYVPTAVCTSTKYHPDCAAVLVTIVGREDVFRCMGRLSQHSFNEDAPKPEIMPSTTEKDYRLKERAKHLSCDHNIDWDEHFELSTEDAAVWDILMVPGPEPSRKRGKEEEEEAPSRKRVRTD